MAPSRKDKLLRPVNPTIMVSEHSTAKPSNPMQTKTVDSDGSRYGFGVADGKVTLLPKPVKHGQSPEGQERSDYGNLGNLLRRCAIEHADSSPESKRLFWPPSRLRRILTRERIIEELEASPRETPLTFGLKSSAQLADRILDGHVKVFAALLLLEKADGIERALLEGIRDSDLPLQVCGEDLRLYRTLSGQQQHVQCFSDPGWNTPIRDIFSKIYQHEVNPHILQLEDDGHTPKHETFGSNDILPFVHEPDQELRRLQREYGGFGVVSIVKIHPDCHKFHNLLSQIVTHGRFALKQLLEDNLIEFKREVDFLKVFNGYVHPHLVTLLMTWERNGSYYLLFPAANCDLDKYWKKTRPSLDLETVQWTSSQIVGISSAVAGIHNPASIGIGSRVGVTRETLQVPGDEDKYGRHGDLKPDNILLYDSPKSPKGILVVTDMGLSRLNTIVSRSTQSNNKVPTTPRYKAPECDIYGARIKRSYDIWTLGCLALEWVCWQFGDQAARESFILSLRKDYPSGSKKDMFFDMVPQHDDKYEVVIKPEAIEKIKSLHRDPKCTQYFHDLLYLVERDMMVVREEHRIKADQLLEELRKMDSVQNDQYYATPCPVNHPGYPQEPLSVIFRRTATTDA